MDHFLKAQIRIDNGGSRYGLDRRQLTIKGYAPEFRLGIERRRGVDRRIRIRPRKGNAIERREIFRDSIDINCPERNLS